MNKNLAIHAAMILSASLAACGEAAPNPGVQPMAPLAPATPISPVGTPAATGAGGSAPIATMAPPLAGPAAPTMPVANPTAPGTPQTQPITPVMDPKPAEMGTGDARFPDACSERRASWSKPCSTNPDPCNLKSGYPGDEYCLLPPPEGKGIQVHFGPKNYRDMAEVAKYVVKPNEEFNSYGIANVPDTGTTTRYFQYLKISMRPGSHHLINNLISGKPTEGFVQGRVGCEGTSMGSFPGTQNLITEMPPQGIPAPENVGLGRTLPPNVSICQNYHRYNTTDKPLLNEIWYNIWWIPESEIKEKTSGVTLNGLITSIPPKTKQVITATTTASGDGRFVTLFGHRHAHTERFAAWLNDKLIYDSWDWMESRVFNYDSITENPAPNPAMQTDGAVSGMLNFKRGDTVKIECHINNTSDTTLRFANELLTGEMCILFGATVGTGIGGAGH